MAKLPERIEEALDRAKDARTDAQLLIEQGGSHSGAVNRLYDATFHAAQAVRHAYGKHPTSMDRSANNSGNTSSWRGRRLGRRDDCSGSFTIIDWRRTMGKTKDQHSKLEQLSRGKLRMVLSAWVVNSLDTEDYAFDFEVRPNG